MKRHLKFDFLKVLIVCSISAVSIALYVKLETNRRIAEMDKKLGPIGHAIPHLPERSDANEESSIYTR